MRGRGVRRLLVLRHAKAGSTPRGEPDHDRPLAAGAEATLRSVSRDVSRLADGGVDLVLASSARRVRATVAAAVREAGIPAQTHWLRQLYLADADRLLAAVREAPAEARNVLVCGHNPGVHQLVATLAEGADGPVRLPHEFPPASLAAIDFDAEWADIVPGAGRLVWFSAPPW